MMNVKKVFLIIGVIFMVNLAGCKGAFKYAKYESKFLEMGIKVDYPAGWIYRDSREAKGRFAQVLFIENKEGDFLKATFWILSTSYPKSAAKPASVEVIASEKIAKRLKFKDSRLVSNSTTKIKGTKARDIVFSYKTIDKLNSVGGGLVAAMERIVIFERKNKFFIISYENTQDNYKKYSPAFDRLLRSLKFSDSK